MFPAAPAICREFEITMFRVFFDEMRFICGLCGCIVSQFNVLEITQKLRDRDSLIAARSEKLIF